MSVRKTVCIPADLLDKIINEIVYYEQVIDYEFGMCQTAKQLIESGQMPELYYELVAIKKSN